LKLKDQLNNILSFEAVPKRIVSLVPSQTELLVDLGLEDRIVGITKFCIHPTRLKNHKTIVGGTKKVHYQKIKDLDPDIIICNKEENDIYTIADVKQLFLDLGTIFNKVSFAKKLESELEDKVTSFKKFIKNRPQKKVAYMSRYPEIQLEQLSRFKPDLILLSSEPYPFKEKHASILQEYCDADIMFVDGEFFSWYGSRLIQSFDYFKTLHA